MFCWGKEGLRIQPPIGVAFFRISLGDTFGCGLRVSDRKPQCWGESPPAVPASAPALTTISAGATRHACGLAENQTAYCWGDTEPIPANLQDTRFAFITASKDPNSNAACGIPADQDLGVQCWGSPLPAGGVPTGVNFSSIGLGQGFGAGINRDTRLVEYFGFGECTGSIQGTEERWTCTGNDAYGFVDDLLGYFPPALSGRNVAVEDPISVGRNGACAPVRSGVPGPEGLYAPRCWGRIDFNINESATPDSKATPYTFDLLNSTALTGISVGVAHACGRRLEVFEPSPQEEFCWGFESHGEFAPSNPSPVPTPTPPPITSPRTIYSVEAGELFSCRITESDNTVQCWGRPGPRTEPPGEAFFQISLGLKFGCGVRLSDQKPQCWGESPPAVPASAPALTTISAAAEGFACGLTENQTAYCWGNAKPIPASLVDTRFASITASKDHVSDAVCGIPVDEALGVQCWGHPLPDSGLIGSTKYSSIGHAKFWCGINKHTRVAKCSGGAEGFGFQQGPTKDSAKPHPA